MDLACDIDRAALPCKSQRFKRTDKPIARVRDCPLEPLLTRLLLLLNSHREKMSPSLAPSTLGPRNVLVLDLPAVSCVLENHSFEAACGAALGGLPCKETHVVLAALDGCPQIAQVAEVGIKDCF